MFKLTKFFKKGDWLFLILAIGLIVSQVFLELKMPEYTKALTEILTSPASEQSMSQVWINGGYMMLCALGSMALAILTSIIIAKISSSLSHNIRDELFKEVMNFSQKEINNFSIASLITRTTNDVVQIQNFFAMGLHLLLKAPIMAIWAITKITETHIEWAYAMIMVVVLIAIMVGALIFIVIPRFKKIQKLTDKLNDNMRENISGVRVIRAFNAEEYQSEKFEKTNNQFYKNNIVTSESMSIMAPMMTLLMNGLTLAIYIIAAILINNIKVSSPSDIFQRAEIISSMAVFTSYAMQVIMSFMMLIIVFIILPRTLVSARRINEVLASKSTIVDGNGDVATSTKGTIRFENVSFSYNNDNHYVLKNLNLDIKQGETVAFIGATGSGKTSIINLIPRFYDASEGNIYVDGVNVKDYKLEDLRNKISIATQKASLFKGTIKDNVIYGDKDGFDENRYEKALEISHADFVNELENKGDSEVAQGGTNYSGGQKQRISIARAVYKKSEILIFDDTFSALDYKTDMLVRKSIKENLTDSTVLIVAQRIGTIKNANKIVVIDQGEIVGIGKHEELLNTCPIYKEIALSQLSQEEL